MTDDVGGKYITIRALNWLSSAWSCILSWLFDEEQGYKHATAVASFILGAIVMRIEPRAFYYTAVAAGALFILTFLVGCLVPIALLVEWALRKISIR